MKKEYSIGFRQMSDIYLESIASNDVKQKIIEEQRQQILEYKNKKEKDDEEKELDPVGKEDKDIDNDGDSDETDDYLLNRRKVRSVAINKKVNEDFKFEGFYDWRSTVTEDIQAALDELDADQITAKSVNNYSKGKNGKPAVKINPNVNLKEAVDSFGGELVYESEINLEEAVEIASDYFYNEGLTAEGVEIVIEELGDDGFYEFVMDLVEDFVLTEARRSGRIEPVTKTGKNVASLKGGAKAAAINRLRKEKQARRETETGQQKSSGMTAAFKAQAKIARSSAVKTAKQNQPEPPSPTKRKRGILDVVASHILSGIERDRQAREKFAQTKAGKALSTTGQVISGAAKSASKAMENPTIKKAERNLTAAAIKGARTATRTARNVAAKETARRRVYSEDYFEEKAVSEQQQKLFGTALSVKRGQTSRKKVSKEVLEIVDSMSEAEIRKFAKTKHEGIPHKKEEFQEGLSYEDILRFMRK